MSIKESINSIRTHLGETYTVLQSKGATMPDAKNMENLPATVETVSAGGGSDNPYEGYALAFADADGGQVLLKNSTSTKYASVFAQSCYDDSSARVINFPTPVSVGDLDKNKVVSAYIDATDVSIGGWDYLCGGETSTSAFANLQRFELKVTGALREFLCQNATSLTEVILHEGLTGFSDSAFSGCAALALLKLPNSLVHVGEGFCYRCNALQELYIPAGCTPPTDKYSLSTTSSSAAAYTNGIVLKGAGAAAWKAALPDRNTSPYRKLLVPVTLATLQDALDKGTAQTLYPAGFEVYDTWDGNYNPLIVAHYTTTTNEDGETLTQVYLVRKFVESAGKAFGSNNNYSASTINTYLQGEYFNKSSDEAKELVREINVPWHNGSSMVQVPSKFFVMSGIEIGGTYNSGEGVFWDYWKQKTGLTTPSDSANTGRIMKLRDGTAVNVWLRSRYDSSRVCCVRNTGNLGIFDPSAAYGVLPACALIQNPVPDAPDLSKVLTADDFNVISRIVKAGKAAEKFNLGDEVKVNYGSYVMPFEVVGFDDAVIKVGGVEKTVPAINLLAKYTSEFTSPWHTTGSVVNYSNSTLHANITNTYQSKLNADFLACIGVTKVQTYSGNGSTDVVYDKLFAPSMAQLGVTDSNYYKAIDGSAFTAYQGAANAKRIKNCIDATGTARYYWTRSLYSGDSNGFGFVLTSGAPNYVNYSNSLRVVVACNFIGEY